MHLPNMALPPWSSSISVRSRPRHGRSGGARTPNPRFWRPVLYQLSYTPKSQCRAGLALPSFLPKGFRGGSAGFAGARAYSRSEGVVEPCRGRSFLKSQGVEISARIGLAHPPIGHRTARDNTLGIRSHISAWRLSEFERQICV